MIRRQFSVVTTAVLLATVFAVGNRSAHGQQMYVADTGVLKVEAGQTLRLVATGTGSEPITVVFRRAKYVETSTGSVVRMQRVSETVSDTIVLQPDQAAASSEYYIRIDVVKGEILSSSRNLKVSAFLIGPAPSSTGGSNGSSALPMEQISFNFTNVTFEYFQ